MQAGLQLPMAHAPAVLAGDITSTLVSCSPWEAIMHIGVLKLSALQGRPGGLQAHQTP